MTLDRTDIDDIERLVAGYGTAATAATRLGISQSTLSRYRSGKLAPTHRSLGWLRQSIMVALTKLREEEEATLTKKTKATKRKKAIKKAGKG